LVSVGTYVPTSFTPAQGYTIVFDVLGGGSIYTALNTAVTLTGADRVTSLSSPRAVDMGDIKLTTNVIPVTMIGVAYLLDQVTLQLRCIRFIFYHQNEETKP
jgi:drug/metabolite transporter (DMT)-like permease